MKLKCISERLNTVAFDENRKPHKIGVGDTFSIKAKKVPEKWRGLVAVVDDGAEKKTAATNPANAGQPKTAETKQASTPGSK